MQITRKQPILILSIISSFFPIFGNTDLVVPWVTDNNGFRSEIFINNLNAQTATVSLTATRPDGATTTSVIQTGPLEQFTAEPETVFPGFGQGSGFAIRLQSQADRIYAGFIISGTGGSGDSPAQANVLDRSQVSRTLLFPYMRTGNDFFSAPVIVNGNEQEARVTFYAYQDGHRYQSTTYTAPPGHTPTAWLVQELFPTLEGPVFLIAWSDQPIMGTAFGFNADREPSMSSALPITEIPGPGKKADMVFTNGIIYSTNPAESVAVRDGKIAFIGSSKDSQLYIGDQTRVIDLAGKMLLPGFIDNHSHLGEGGEVNCSPRNRQTLAAQASRLANCAAGLKKGAWVIGYGGMLEIVLESETSPLATLDRIFPDHPVIIMDHISHAMFANSQALTRAKFNESTPDPPGGIIMKDHKGELTGVLMDNAGDMVMEIAVNSLNNKFDLIYEGILYGLRQTARNGITSVGDGRTYWRRGMFDAWKKVERDGKLTARVSVRPWIYPELEKGEQLPFLKSAFQNNIDRLLIVNQVKMYIDGVPEYGTGKMIEPYVQTRFPQYPNGINYISRSDMADWLITLNDLGYGAHIHGLGDLGIREALDAIQTARGAGSLQKYHITHLAMVDKADLGRFADLNVDADFQMFAPARSAEERMAWAVPLIGRERARELLMNPVGEMQKTGANVVLSSDWTVNPLSPLNAISHAVTEGSLNIDQAIRAYTINPARALGLDSVTGSIELNKSADFVVLDRDLTRLSPEEILRAKVVMTVLRGEIVYQ